MGFEREHCNASSLYNRHFCRTKKIVQDVVDGLGIRACTKIVTIRLFNAQGMHLELSLGLMPSCCKMNKQHIKCKTKFYFYFFFNSFNIWKTDF